MPLSINAAANAVLSFATGCIILGNFTLTVGTRPRATPAGICNAPTFAFVGVMLTCLR